MQNDSNTQTYLSKLSNRGYKDIIVLNNISMNKSELEEYLLTNNKINSLEILTSNYVNDKLTDKINNLSNITSNNSNYFINKFLQINTDTIPLGNNNKFIVNNYYDSNLTINGIIQSSNIFINNKNVSKILDNNNLIITSFIDTTNKNLINIEGDHNSYRPKFFKDSAGIFFYNTLQVEYLKQISDDYAGFIYSKNESNEPNTNNNLNNNEKLCVLIVNVYSPNNFASGSRYSFNI